MLFKSSLFGDDVDRALQKNDGSWTYFANDLAYHFNKVLPVIFQPDYWSELSFLSLMFKVCDRSFARTRRHKRNPINNV